MTEQYFFLKPFHKDRSLPDLKITSTIIRRSGIFSIQYKLFGNLAEVLIPEPAARPGREHNLWERTCFEFFLAGKDSPQYWEFNLSPSGDWNVYCFEYYRQKEMKEEMAFTSLPFRVHNQQEALMIDLNLNLDKIVQADQSLEIGISSVIQLKNGKMTYWALTHAGQRPDFHMRESFIIGV